MRLGSFAGFTAFAGVAVAVATWTASAEAQQVLEADEVVVEGVPHPGGKAGPYMINVKGGPSFNVAGEDLAAVVQADLGYAILRGQGSHFSDGDFYLVLSPEVEVGEFVSLQLPLGFQYEFAVARGLFVYPRSTVGYGVIINPGDGESGDAFVWTHALGAKYLVSEDFHLGVEPVSVPLHVGAGDPQIEYRALGYGGVNL
jgi:hypothetical protein